MTRGAKQSPQMTEALRLIIVEGKSQYAAAKLAGITPGAISKNQQYRDHIKSKGSKS